MGTSIIPTVYFRVLPCVHTMPLFLIIPPRQFPTEPTHTFLHTGRLFVRNLAYTATEADLSEAFGRYGDLEEVHLVLDRSVLGRLLGAAVARVASFAVCGDDGSARYIIWGL